MTLNSLQKECVCFGRSLLNTADLDPLYTMLVWAQPGRRLLGRFLLAYGMFYHARVAAEIAEAEDFWAATEAVLPSAPRGTERRHFRGQLATKTARDLKALGEPEMALSQIYPRHDRPIMTFRDVFEGAQTLTGFGPWIAFKMADIADRTGYHVVDFTGCNLSLYRDPVKGAALWRYGDQDATIAGAEVGEVCEEIRLAVGADLPAPPLYDRAINIQEVETVLCKWKSSRNGHYPIGKDTREIRHGLAGSPSRLASLLAECPLL